jgi:cytidylate kinase
MSNFISIAIDGPSGAGKSSLAKNVAKKLGFIYLDTGALYRAVGLFVCEKNIAGDNVKAIEDCIERAKSGEEEMSVTFAHDTQSGEQKIFLNMRDVSKAIRENNISKYASDVSKIPKVRDFLFDKQRNFANQNNVVMDGRDIGTAILPDADVKIFLTASAENRARRRYDELVSKGQKDIKYEQVLQEMKERDAQDSGRDIVPLRPAEDAVMLDNSGLQEAETLEKALNIIKEKLPYVDIR